MICMDFFIAGAQTTSTTLDFVFIMMLLYPDVQRRAQAQLDAVVGRGRPPQLADRNKYVHCGCCTQTVPPPPPLNPEALGHLNNVRVSQTAHCVPITVQPLLHTHVTALMRSAIALTTKHSIISSVFKLRASSLTQRLVSHNYEYNSFEFFTEVTAMSPMF
jgi:hypothetical protein